MIRTVRCSFAVLACLAGARTLRNACPALNMRIHNAFKAGGLIGALTLPLALAAGEDAWAQPVPRQGDGIATVMARNVYHGVNDEIFAVADAASFDDLLNRVAAVYQGYFTRDFHERAAAIAAEIDAARPELIGVQEAVLVRTQFPADGPATPATTVVLDYVQILLDALAARGLQYQVAVQMTGLDAELPSALGIDVRHTDREVILARADLTSTDLSLSNAQANSFLVNCELPGPLGGPPIVIRRGWVSVDANVRGRNFRFVSTHLDGDCLSVTTAIQQAQATQLLAQATATNLPVVLVGDLNSPGDGSGVTYNAIRAAGFSDAWKANSKALGNTCCQASDLLNVASTLQSRIDFVLFTRRVDALEAQVTGDKPPDKTVSGLWPSDHGGVVATLEFGRSR